MRLPGEVRNCRISQNFISAAAANLRIPRETLLQGQALTLGNIAEIPRLVGRDPSPKLIRVRTFCGNIEKGPRETFSSYAAANSRTSAFLTDAPPAFPRSPLFPLAAAAATPQRPRAEIVRRVRPSDPN